MTNTPELRGPEKKPASGGKAKQLIMFLHGLGADGNDLIGLAPMLTRDFPDAHFVSPNAPFPCDMAPYGFQWFSLQTRNPDTMLAGVKTAAPILNAYIDKKLAELNLGDDKLALIGFSQGTMMSLYTSLRRENPIAGVVGFSGAMIGDIDITQKEVKSKPPICLIHGDDDTVVPYGAMPHAVDILKKLNVPVEDHTREGLGHGIDPEGLDAAIAFLKKRLT